MEDRLQCFASPFWALCQWDMTDDPLLLRIGEYLDDGDTQAYISESEANRTYPIEVRKSLHKLGVADVLYSGKNISRSVNTLPHYFGLLHLCAGASMSVAIDVGVNMLGLLPIYVAGSQEQRDRALRAIANGEYFSNLISEQNHGSDVLANETSYRRVKRSVNLDEDSLFLNGQKDWINGGSTHENLLVLATEKMVSTRRNPRSLDLIWINSQMQQPNVVRRWNNIPAPAADIASVCFEELPFDRSNILGSNGSGFALIQDAFSITRGAVGAGVSGIVASASNQTKKYINERHLYNKPIGDLGAIAAHQRQISALELLISSVTLKCLYVQNLYGCGAAHYSNITKVVSVEMAEELARHGRLIHGAKALLEEYTYYRTERDLPLAGIFDGTTHVCLEQIQWRLLQSSSGKGSSSADISAFQQIFSTTKKNIYEVFEISKNKSINFNPADYANYLYNTGVLQDQSVCVVARSLVSRVVDLQKDGDWLSQQHTRHVAAKALCYLECVFSLLEVNRQVKDDVHSMAFHYSLKQCCEFTVSLFHSSNKCETGALIEIYASSLQSWNKILATN